MTVASEIAENLLAIKAVKLQPKMPFTWASGIKSPIYTDNRQTIGYPKVRQAIAKGLSELINQHFPTVDIIGGVATAGIPHAAWVADVMVKPMIYVRSKPKDHGAGKQIEGLDVAGKAVVLIDDLISTGGSVLGAVEAVRAAGGTVLGVVAIFSYELAAAEINFASAQVPFYVVTNYSTLIEVAKKNGDINAEELALLHRWRENPQAW
ncbi:orotate phosphoribosyltransferase [Weissella oryzae SG25]|uniref:Orotate phosphoribosyltransferase n=2 Tax=Weissella TaxID=46255 RepID=A0A069CSW8_WEIOS|nr:orotate phosphoribosyltransferase [Weissella oryzae SG25]